MLEAGSTVKSKATLRWKVVAAVGAAVDSGGRVSPSSNSVLAADGSFARESVAGVRTDESEENKSCRFSASE